MIRKALRFLFPSIAARIYTRRRLRQIRLESQLRDRRNPRRFA